MKKSELKALIKEVVQEVYSQQNEGLFDMFKSNQRKLMDMFKKEGFDDALDDNDDGNTLSKAMELHDDGTEGVVELAFFKDEVIWHVSEDGFLNDDNWGTIKIPKKATPNDLQKIVSFIMHKVNRTDAPSPNSAAYKKWHADREARRLTSEPRDNEGEEWKNR